MFELNRSSKQTEEDLALRLKTLQDEFSLYQHNSQQQIRFILLCVFSLLDYQFMRLDQLDETSHINFKSCI